MARATATPRADRTIRLRDGRDLAYSEWGDLAGRPVVLLHGTPGSRLICLDEDDIPNMTLVTYPGEAHLFPFDHWAEMLAAMA
jgi:hypothetical protein